MNNSVTALLAIVVLATLIGLSCKTGYEMANDKHGTPPCMYGTTDMMVREVNGQSRVVCGCPR